MTNLRHELNARAATQHSLLSRADLREVGVSSGQRRNLLSDGSLVPIGHQTFALGGVASTPHQRVMAACLDTGGVASHGTAAWLHGIAGFGPGEPPAVVVRRPRYDYRLPIAEVHTTSWLPVDDVVDVRGIACLGVARSLFSLASAVPTVAYTAVANAVDEAVRDGKASDAWLWWLLERVRRRGRNGVSVFEALLTARAGGAVTESWLERELLRVLAAAGVPLPECQRRVCHQGAFLARVDFVYPGPRIVIEVSGHAHHSTRLQTAADARRRNDLQLAGYQVLEFTYDQVVGDPSYVAAKVLDALAASVRRAS